MQEVQGYLEISNRRFGFLRQIEQNFRPGPDDIFVSNKLITELNLQEGSFIRGKAQLAAKNAKDKPQLIKVEKINHLSVAEYRKRKQFKANISVNPYEPFNLVLDQKDAMGHILNFVTPMGKGQRGLIVSPPKAGKTTILKHIAKAILQNHPDTQVFVLLVDERPEEVTDFRRSLPGATVLYSSADESVQNHLRMTKMAMQVAIRKAEAGEDVIILIDSLTRMGRAFNSVTNSHGRTMTGGLSANALNLPRQFFGAARKIEHGGSLTIMATILVDTGSAMDQIIFQEFKGTGNLDLVLSQKCAERRIFPAINLKHSGTRREELLLSEEQLKKYFKLRQLLAQINEPEDTAYLISNWQKLLL